mmetsp:Transcript_73959/g.130645  ORF Transcript_73959/g.130645 Transcript_73959/m.130645 type:complete len:612 (-) Transcript_73959:35-1870(-)|eukprot:CAMPEP_0197661648 /NCGR_PEP_ID=MMETSP1338-20131121/51573_1 /TAXON_ID=43686 ORGANISM="Pelagodinium beii, Strain RCC1491" /NCGR_SAMPLE_ID=MMETSP1338 /ASSEMBLY_ACC=CAM_ASM_000754 /LENGTH=611 /DNA_ID=CAMNT_0043239231 /DNA_START=52 /DNA_END=1887 /DNA_ORIENTATION=+
MPRSSRSLSAPLDWVRPLPDPFVEAELQAAAKEPLGAEVWAEAEESGLTNGAAAEVQAITSLLEAPLAALALAIDAVSGGGSDVTGRSTAVHAAVSSRFFCAAHVAKAAKAARKVERLDRALRFRGHPDFKPAALELDDEALDLEAADDVFDLQASQLRALMAQRGAVGIAAQEAARALFTLLVDGRPTHPVLSSYSGLWGSDRMVLEPSVLLPLLYNRNALEASRDVFARLRTNLCQLRERIAPATILAANEEGDEGSEAAAALLQWAWLQVAMKELLDSTAGPGTSSLGPLECRLLLQPSKALAKLQKRKTGAMKVLMKIRADPLRASLSDAWRDRRMPPPRRQLVQDARSSQRRRPESGAKSRRGPATEGIRGHRSLPALGLGQHLLPSSAEPGSPVAGAGQKNLPSLGVMGQPAYPVDAGSGGTSPVSVAGRSRGQGSRSWQSPGQSLSDGQARRTSSGLQASAGSDSTGRSRRGRGEQNSQNISLRKALGLPETAEGNREGSHSRSRSCGGTAPAAAPVAFPSRPQSSTMPRRRAGEGLGASRPQSSTSQRPHASEVAVPSNAARAEPAQRVCAWAYPQASQAPSSLATGGLPFAPSGMPWVTPMR